MHLLYTYMLHFSLGMWNSEMRFINEGKGSFQHVQTLFTAEIGGLEQLYFTFILWEI